MQPIKVESRNSGTGQATLQSEGWRVVGFARSSAARTRRKRPSTRRGRRLIASVFLVFFLALIAGGGVMLWRTPATLASMVAQGWGSLDRAAGWSGLAIRQISLSGHRYASDIDLFEVLNEHTARSLVGIDVKAASDALTELSWVKSADIERKFPDELLVRIEERSPYAVWHVDNQYWLIDKKGGRLAPVTEASFRELAHVSGNGADKKIAGFLDRLNGYPQLRSEISLISRVGDRRWSLTFKSGLTVELPARGEGETIAKLDQLRRDNGILDSGLRSIDLRLADRIIIRRSAAYQSGTLTTSDLIIRPNGKLMVPANGSGG